MLYYVVVVHLTISYCWWSIIFLPKWKKYVSMHLKLAKKMKTHQMDQHWTEALFIQSLYTEFPGFLFLRKIPSLIRTSIWVFCVQAITLYCMNGFPYNLAEVSFILIVDNAAIQPVIFLSSLYFSYAWKDNKIIWHKCLPYQDDVSRERTPISKVKVTLDTFSVYMHAFMFRL